MRGAILLLFLIPIFAFCGSRPATNGISGVGVVIREYDVPTPNSRPHDPAVAPDGALWYKIGKIDPKTLDVTEIVLPNPESRPRRISNNPDGSICYSDFARGFIGRLDLKTAKIEEWASPGGPDSRPYGIASTSDGTLWYSESGVKPNALVAFNPKTKAFQSWPIPSGGGRSPKHGRDI